MKLILVILVTSVSMLMVYTSCTKDKVLESSVISSFCTDTVSFSTEVEPLIQMNCSTLGCHDAVTAAFGYNLEGYSNISLHANNVLNTMQHKPGYTSMPFGGTMLADTLVQKVDCWIQQGKNNN